jgi:hypothetical protein
MPKTHGAYCNRGGHKNVKCWKINLELRPKKDKRISHVLTKEEACWPLIKFWRSLLMFDLFWDFGRLVEGGAQVEEKIARSWTIFREYLGLGFM